MLAWLVILLIALAVAFFTFQANPEAYEALMNVETGAAAFALLDSSELPGVKCTLRFVEDDNVLPGHEPRIGDVPLDVALDIAHEGATAPTGAAQLVLKHLDERAVAGEKDGGRRGFAVRPTGDGGYIVAGTTESFGNGGIDCYVVKTTNTINHDSTLSFFNPTSFLMEKAIEYTPDEETHTLYSDYREVGGILRAFHQEINTLPICAPMVTSVRPGRRPARKPSAVQKHYWEQYMITITTPWAVG